jgi:hypothetical protein
LEEPTVTTPHPFHPAPRQGRGDAHWLRSSLKKVFEVDDAADFGQLLARLDESGERRMASR